MAPVGKSDDSFSRSSREGCDSCQVASVLGMFPELTKRSNQGLCPSSLQESPLNLNIEPNAQNSSIDRKEAGVTSGVTSL